MLFEGHDTDYLNLALKDGGVSLSMGLSNGKQEMHIKPARVRFDDHQWHKVTVHRRIQEVKGNLIIMFFSNYEFYSIQKRQRKQKTPLAIN